MIERERGRARKLDQRLSVYCVRERRESEREGGTEREKNEREWGRQETRGREGGGLAERERKRECELDQRVRVNCVRVRFSQLHPSSFQSTACVIAGGL